jgi:hypothetical protein
VVAWHCVGDSLESGGNLLVLIVFGFGKFYLLCVGFCVFEQEKV